MDKLQFKKDERGAPVRCIINGLGKNEYFTYIESDDRREFTEIRKRKYRIGVRRFLRSVSLSDRYDKEFIAWQGNARTALLTETRKELSCISKKSVIDLVIMEWEAQNGKKLDISGDTLPFIRLLVDYSFSHAVFGHTESEFSHSRLLVHRIGNNRLETSLNKGLFIVGTCGLGKSSIVMALDSIIKNSDDRMVVDVENNEVPLGLYRGNYCWLNRKTAKQLHKTSKDEMPSMWNSRTLLIDDLFTEPKPFFIKETGEYVKSPLSEIIEGRYDAKVKTHVICNWVGDLTLENMKIQRVLTEYTK